MIAYAKSQRGNKKNFASLDLIAKPSLKLSFVHGVKEKNARTDWETGCKAAVPTALGYIDYLLAAS